MKHNKTKIYLTWIALSEATGLLSGFLNRSGIAAFQETVLQPPLSPPAIVFSVVWTILYGLMGFSAARIFLTPASFHRSAGLNLFVIQLLINFFWSFLFFDAQVYGFSLFWLLLLWLTTLLMVFSFGKTDLTAALLQIPYLLWLTFAAYLNYGVWQLNR